MPVPMIAIFAMCRSAGLQLVRRQGGAGSCDPADRRARRNGDWSTPVTRYFVAYFAAAVAMAVLDLGWLSYAVKAFFEPAVGGLLAEKTNNTAAVLFYV